MAMFTLIEINGDHLSDLLGKGGNIGQALYGIVQNTHNAERILEETELYRVLRVVKQSGEQFRASGFSRDGQMVKEPETPMIDATRMRLQIEHLNKMVEVQTRQIQSLSERLEDMEGDDEADASRIDALTRRVMALEAWRKA